MIDIRTCPSTLQEGHNGYCRKALKHLFNAKAVNPILDFEIDEFRTGGELIEAMHRISVSGVQEKFPAIIDGDRIRIAKDYERATHIIKPAPWDKTLANRKQIPSNEHLTMQIASQVYGISTAANGLCFTRKGQPVYITRRFDILSDTEKLRMEDFASVVGRNEQIDGLQFKYNGSYEDIAKAIRKNIAAWMVDVERFFELVLFNYIYGNGDDHLKNFSLIHYGDDFRLAPAYDLLNTALHTHSDDFGLDGALSPHIEKSDVWERSGHPCHIDFERFGRRIGITERRLSRIIDRYSRLPEQTCTLTARSFLNNKMKRSYLRIVNERIARFTRTAR